MQFCGKNATSAFFCCDGTDGVQCNCSDSQGLFALTGLDIYGQIILETSGTVTAGTLSMFTQGQSLTVSAPITAMAMSSSVSSVPSTSLLPSQTPATATGTVTGLSTAAKAGIGVAAAVGMLLLLAIGILALKVNRQHRRILQLEQPTKLPRARYAGEDPAHANVLDKAELLGTTPATGPDSDPVPASETAPPPPAAVTQQDAPVMVESAGHELGEGRSVHGAREPEVSELQ
jgi:hypothetical protein